MRWMVWRQRNLGCMTSGVKKIVDNILDLESAREREERGIR